MKNLTLPRYIGATDPRAACHARIDFWKRAPSPLFSRGFNGEGRYQVPVIYSNSRATIFRDERPVHDALPRLIEHRGWYTDPDGISSKDGSGLCWGIVASLSHGRYLAGYEIGDSDGRTYFLDVYSGEGAEREACHAADEHARVIADQEREYQQRHNEARAVADRIEEKEQRLAECLALRHDKRPCFAGLREEARRCIGAIRKARERLATDYAGVDL